VLILTAGIISVDIASISRRHLMQRIYTTMASGFWEIVGEIEGIFNSFKKNIVDASMQG
jgi:hypothetical protein